MFKYSSQIKAMGLICDIQFIHSPIKVVHVTLFFVHVGILNVFGLANTPEKHHYPRSQSI
jgi:amino acid permease